MLVGGALQRQFNHGRSPLDASWVERFVMEGNSVMAMGPIEDCASGADLEDWLEQFAREFGFDGGRYLHMGHRYVRHRPHGAAPAEPPPLRFLSTLEKGQEPWRAGDPSLAKITHAFAPFVWSTKDDLSLPDLQRAWLSVERVRGVDAGIAIPVQDYLSGPAYISLFSRTVAEAAAAIALRCYQIVALGIEFHIRVKQLIPSRSGRAGALSDREISCLRHAASGATLVETAASLGIAPRTVELHFARATRKLGAANRINAVAIATGAGLIHV